MRPKVTLALVVLAGLLAAMAMFRFRSQPAEPAAPQEVESAAAPDHRSEGRVTPPPQIEPSANSAPAATNQLLVSQASPEQPAITNKLQRLTDIREAFRTLAAGNQKAAMLAAKQLTNENERETALLTMVTEWTHGELGPARRRAGAIAAYGLEAGLGMELAKTPELAVLWADQLTDGPGRTALLHETAIGMLGSDPAAAFALGEQLPPDERSKFINSVFVDWGAKDTQAALQYADELPDAPARDAALQTIRTAAPIGIGAVLSMQDGYPAINQLVPGMPADRSGQLRSGDRILALAQGDNSFIDARDLPLNQVVQMIRGAPGTVLQLQVLSADAPPNSPPRMVSIIRDQVKFKQ